jgi:glycosyltransferase involved in cell wall biosynthesis
MRNSLGVPKEATLLGIVARLQPWKNQHVFIETIARLRARGLPAIGMIVGGEAFGLSHDYAVSLPPLAHRLGVADAVIFAGQVADVRPYLAAMDVAVSLSDKEPFGLAIVEAMSASLPVIAVRSGGPTGILSQGGGLLIDSPTADALAEAAARLIDDVDLRRRLGETGRRLYLDRYRPPRMAADIAGALSVLARHGRRPAALAHEGQGGGPATEGAS